MHPGYLHCIAGAGGWYLFPERVGIESTVGVRKIQQLYSGLASEMIQKKHVQHAYIAWSF